jgi:hypothetical protein
MAVNFSTRTGDLNNPGTMRIYLANTNLTTLTGTANTMDPYGLSPEFTEVYTRPN